VTRQDVAWSVSRLSEEGLSLARYNDKVILSVAKRMGLPLLSFDRRLLAQAARAGVAVIDPYSA